MDERKTIAVKKFLHSVKGAVMAMDVDSLKDEQLNEVYSGFAELKSVIDEENQ